MASLGLSTGIGVARATASMASPKAEQVYKIASMPMPVTYSARATMRCFNAALSVPARARSVLNASSSTLNVSASVQPWRNASTTGCMATGVAWIRAMRFDMPVSSWPQGWSDRGRGAMHHSIGRMPWLYSMSQGMLACASVHSQPIHHRISRWAAPTTCLCRAYQG
jgi:hypothetical protein